jgi:hypothetical protein
MRSIILFVMVVVAQAIEAIASRLFNMYILDENHHLNVEWYGNIASRGEKGDNETPMLSTSRRRRLEEKRVETISKQKTETKAKMQKKKTSASTGEFMQPLCFVSRLVTS